MVVLVTTELLDNTGVRFDMTRLSAWPGVQAARKALRGSNWLSRFWKQKLFPYLFPRRCTQLRDDLRAATTALTIEFMTSVISNVGAKTEIHIGEGEECVIE